MDNCVFAGTFDPVTKGHEDIIKKCLKEYSKVYVVIGENKDKTPFFTLNERERLLKATFSSKKNIQVVFYSDFNDYSKFLSDNKITFYVRGIRNEVDYEFEKKYEEINGKLYPFVKTEYVRADGEYVAVSSTLVKERILNGGDYLSLVPNGAIPVLKEILKEKGVEK